MEELVRLVAAEGTDPIDVHRKAVELLNGLAQAYSSSHSFWRVVHTYAGYQQAPGKQFTFNVVMIVKFIPNAPIN